VVKKAPAAGKRLAEAGSAEEACVSRRTAKGWEPLLDQYILKIFQMMRQLIQTLYTHKKSKTMPKVNLRQYK
jgi:hypothetical protein